MGKVRGKYYTAAWYHVIVQLYMYCTKYRRDMPRTAQLKATAMSSPEDSPENSLLLLKLLTGATSFMLLLVLIDKLFRDYKGHAGQGYTRADKAAFLSFLSLLARYAIGYKCWSIRSGHWDPDTSTNTTTRTRLSSEEETKLTVGGRHIPIVRWFLSYIWSSRCTGNPRGNPRAAREARRPTRIDTKKLDTRKSSRIQFIKS